ncbi:hypothetical protein, partial [Oceanicola sp. S124]|uniref:hypothetical protein n=1 Tax=Oceanicola sp. S124 TaxID=1042378 RepID=UPI00058B8ADD
MFKMPFSQSPAVAHSATLLRLALVVTMLMAALADPAAAKRGGNGNGGGNQEEEEEEPVEATGITHVIYFVGFAFFP